MELAQARPEHLSWDLCNAILGDALLPNLDMFLRLNKPILLMALSVAQSCIFKWQCLQEP